MMSKVASPLADSPSSAATRGVALHGRPVRVGEAVAPLSVAGETLNVWGMRERSFSQESAFSNITRREAPAQCSASVGCSLKLVRAPRSCSFSTSMNSHYKKFRPQLGPKVGHMPNYGLKLGPLWAKMPI